jgi:hypothetical protein
MRNPTLDIVSLIALAAASAVALSTAEPAPFVCSDQAAAAATTNATLSAAAGRRGGGRGRGAPDLGPVPEIHAPVPNTLRGLQPPEVRAPGG